VKQDDKRVRLLIGVLVCDVCNVKMRAGRAGGQRNGKPLPKRDVYQCKAGYCVSRTRQDVDRWVEGHLLQRLARPDIEDLMAGTESPTVTAARQQIDRLRADLTEAWDLWDNGDLSNRAYAHKEQKLTAQIAEAESVVRQAWVPIDVVVPPPEQLPGWWQNELTDELRREIVAAFIAEVRVLPVGRKKYDYADYTKIVWRGEA
jgi:hypothetical protein